ncbi:zinc finger protein 82 homolog isoform X2 [Sitodiplosis mosellana]|uniref:zinc finger protein 82 homolog isoform X2 n=1 Tax=Sitodiplosis mosellana TaxID=263140 RepID=UPI002443B94E|nr:zinc finger protein 82 homolog isoform X2 [Sitodiplosis mosellana]
MATLPQTRHCCIQSCVNFKGTTSDKFHFFKPSMERHILDKWKEAISHHQEVKNITFVCNLHFERESMIEMDGHLFLKHGSIPSIFGINPPTDSEIENEEMAVKMEPISTETPNTVQLVNINRIIQNTSTFCDAPTEIDEQIDNVDSVECNGCYRRNDKIQCLLANIEKLKKSQEQKRKLICYWKSLAVYYKRGNREPIVVRVNKLKEKFKITQTKPRKRVKPVSISNKILATELIKVEGKPTGPKDDETNTLFEPETTTIELNEDEKVEHDDKVEPVEEVEEVEQVDITLKKSDAEILNSLLKPYKCGKCDETFEKPTELSRHLNTHRERIPPKPTIKKTYECYICKREFKLSCSIQRHMKVHIESNEKCDVCRSEVTADQHLCIEEENISCEYCPQTFVSTKNLLEHLESAHSEKKLHKCLKCHQYFRMMFLKIIHERNHDIITKPFHCEVCPKSFSIRDSLMNHRQREHANQEEPKKHSHLCDQCGKKFVRQSQLKNHLLWHSEPTIKCPDCPQLFRTRYTLKRHSYIHRNDIFVCSICGVELSSPYGMKDHMRYIHGPMKSLFKCKICAKLFKYKYDLQKHVNAHATGKGFQCTFCTNSYKYRGDLNKHLRIHLGGKIYECKECNERFRLPLELQKHSFEHYKEQQMTANITTEE